VSDDTYSDNVWESELPEVWEGIHGRRLIREEGSRSPAQCGSYHPDREVDYHFHHGTEEFLIVLRGSATLRTQDGDREHPKVRWLISLPAQVALTR
jgi:mannose-6-phosphate isomerase-like protein (cupin superfamily)